MNKRKPSLPARVNVLLGRRQASVGGRTPSQRAPQLGEIAAAYFLDELPAEPCVGDVTPSKFDSGWPKVGSYSAP